MPASFSPAVPMFRRFVYSLLLVLVSLVVTLAAAELTLRVFVNAGTASATKANVPDHLILMPESPRLYALKPSDVRLHTNRFGFRGREYGRRKPSGTYRIVVLGDSVTFGNEESWDGIYTHLLEARLNTELPERRHEVINLSVSGYNTDQELATLREVGLALQPDLILLGVCLNDSDPAKRPTTAGLRDVNRIESLSDINLRTFVASSYVLTYVKHAISRLSNMNPWLQDMLNSERLVINPRVKERAWAEMKETMRELHETASRHGTPLAVVVFPYQSQMRGSHATHLPQRDLETFWAARQVPMLDPAPAFQSAAEPMFNDGLLHLSSAGHRKVADEIYRFLKDERLLPAPDAVR